MINNRCKNIDSIDVYVLSCKFEGRLTGAKLLLPRKCNQITFFRANKRMRQTDRAIKSPFMVFSTSYYIFYGRYEGYSCYKSIKSNDTSVKKTSKNARNFVINLIQLYTLEAKDK